MATASGYIGAAGSDTYLSSAVSLNMTMTTGYYPNGSFTFDNITGGGAYWHNNSLSAKAVSIYLCDSAGNNKIKLFDLSMPAGASWTDVNSATVSGATALTGKALYLIATGDTGYIVLKNRTAVTATTKQQKYTITVASVTGGSVTASAASAAQGTTITLTPSPSTGYKLSGYTTSPSVTVTNNKFTMPGSNITITPSFTKVNHTITVASVTGGTVTASKSTATYGTTITLTPSPNTGYKLSGYTTSPSLTISSNKFTMPDSDITITPSFTKISYTVTVKSVTGGTVTSNKTTATYGETVTLTRSANTGYQFSSYSTSPSVTISSNKFTMPASNITITPSFTKISYTITVASVTGGTVTASKSTATYGTTITLTPSPSTGYQLSGYTTSPSVTISSNKFSMPASNITITPSFTKLTYTITKSCSPAAGGTVTVKKGSSSVSSAQYGDSITLETTTNDGYTFKNYEFTPSLTLYMGTTFSMPASNVTIKANFYKYSTATISSTTLTGGESRTVTITADKTTYTHKVQLRWDTYSKTGTETTLAAGVKTASVSIPKDWASSIPNSLTGSGLTVTVKTYDGSTLIGTYTITGLTYQVPADAVPSVGAIGLSLVKTPDSTTYNKVSTTLYIQNYAKLNIAVSNAAGKYSSTITSIQIALPSYSGTNYNKTVSGTSANWTTGAVLTKAGTCTVNVTVTDSRGRTATASSSVTVQAYSKPTGSLRVVRTNSSGTPDDLGENAKYYVKGSFTAVGSNGWDTGYPTIGDGNSTVQVTVTASETNGFLVPGNKKTYSILQEYTITLTLKDKLNTTTITARLPSSRFIIHTNKTGNNYRLAFMKAADRTVPSGKTSTVEFSADSQIYIGTNKLESLFVETSKIVNNLTTTTAGSVLDATQGKALNDKFSSYVPTSSIKNNLTTTTAGSVLDATQGKALNDKFSSYVPTASIKNNLTTTTAGSVLDATQGKALNDKFSSYVPTANIKNNLTTTASGYVLDARQGKTLSDAVTSTEVSSPVTWNTTNCDSENSSVTMYKIGSIRILSFSLSYKGSGTSWKAMATISSGNRPPNNLNFPVGCLGDTKAHMCNINTSGSIRFYGNTMTSGEVYRGIVTYSV